MVCVEVTVADRRFDHHQLGRLAVGSSDDLRRADSEGPVEPCCWYHPDHSRVHDLGQQGTFQTAHDERLATVAGLNPRAMVSVRDKDFGSMRASDRPVTGATTMESLVAASLIGRLVPGCG